MLKFAASSLPIVPSWGPITSCGIIFQGCVCNIINYIEKKSFGLFFTMNKIYYKSC